MKLFFFLNQFYKSLVYFEEKINIIKNAINYNKNKQIINLIYKLIKNNNNELLLLQNNKLIKNNLYNNNINIEKNKLIQPFSVYL